MILTSTPIINKDPNTTALLTAVAHLAVPRALAATHERHIKTKTQRPEARATRHKKPLSSVKTSVTAMHAPHRTKVTWKHSDKL
jgi:hypothetical protein